MTECDELLDVAVGLEQAKRIVALEAELAELRACHDEHYAGMLAVMAENERLRRGYRRIIANTANSVNCPYCGDFNDIHPNWCPDYIARAALREGK